MNDLKQAVALICVLIGGGFLFLIGAVSMTGIRLDNIGDIAVFVAWNGMVLAIVFFSIRSIVSQTNEPDED